MSMPEASAAGFMHVGENTGLVAKLAWTRILPALPPRSTAARSVCSARGIAGRFSAEEITSFGRRGETTHPADQRWASLGAPDTVAPQCPRTKTRLICTTPTARVQPPTCECRFFSLSHCADRSRSSLGICPSLFLPSTLRGRRPCAAAAGTAWTSRYAVAAHPMVRFKSVSSFPCPSQRAERLARSVSSVCTKPLKLSTRLALSHQNEAKRQGEDARPRRQDFSRRPAYVDRPPLCVAQPAPS